MDEFAKHEIFWVSRCIALGGYPLDDDMPILQKGGITHLFNLDLPYSNAAEIAQLGFEIVSFPITDGRKMPDEKALACLDRFHGILIREGTRVFIHCQAGINRSPTVLWLYLVACGLGLDEAGERIARASPHAVPGDPALCDRRLLDLVLAHGRAHFVPHPRPEVLLPPG